MRNELHRQLAPISEAAWKEVDEEARQTLKVYLAARKLVDFTGPLGWEHSAVNLGRTTAADLPFEGVEGRMRQVQPLLELRVPFELTREAIDSIDRGNAGPDLGPVKEAAKKIAAAEDQIVFSGLESASIVGILSGAEYEPLTLTDDYNEYPGSVAIAVERLRSSGVAGPYAIALGPRCYTGLTTTTTPAGFPVLEHVRRVLDGGALVWAPALSGAVVLSQRGGDFELVVGRDLSIGYRDHNAERVGLYLEESLTFQLHGGEAAVPLAYA